MADTNTGRWRATLPLALVLLSLALLALLPVLVQRRTDRFRAELADVVEPARALVTEIQLALALDVAGARGFALTQGPEYAASHQEARAYRIQAQDRLRPLARQLGPEVFALDQELEARLRPEDELLDALLAGSLTPAGYRANLAAHQARFREAVVTAVRLDRAIRREAAMRAAEIRTTVRIGTALMVILVLLALVAALLVARLGRSYRLLARRLARQNREQESLSEIARALSASLNVRDTVQTIAERAVSTTHAFGAYVERIEEPEPDAEVEIVGVAGTGVPPLGTRIPYPGSLSEEIIGSGEPEIVTSVGSNGERMAPHLSESCGRCSALVVPLLSEGLPLGALVFLRGADQPPCSAEELAHARALGDLASATLRRVLLLEALAESEGRFRQIAEHLREVIWLGNPELTERYYVNPAYEEVWGRTRESFYEHPRSPIEAVHPEDRERVEAALPGLKRGDYDIQFRIIRPDGQVRWIWSRGYPIRDERGEIYRVAGIMEDVTDQKAAQVERERLLDREREARAESEEARGEAERQREELERVTASRTLLMRGFSHDVKNPLGAADGHAALLEEGVLGELTEKQRESVERIRRSIGTSLRLIGDLLDVARAEAGQIEIQCVRTDVAATVREVAEDFRAQVTTAGLALEIQSPEHLVAMTDPARLRQVLSNLLSNAVKYTPRGRITLTGEAPGEGQGPRPGDWIAVHVTDTGPGIPEEDREHIFQEFTRLDPEAPHGAGVGLAISRRIARLLGGEITLESEVGRGSTFTLWLPRAG